MTSRYSFRKTFLTSKKARPTRALCNYSHTFDCSCVNNNASACDSSAWRVYGTRLLSTQVDYSKSSNPSLLFSLSSSLRWPYWLLLPRPAFHLHLPRLLLKSLNRILGCLLVIDFHYWFTHACCITR